VAAGELLITECHAVRGLIDRTDLARVILRVIADRRSANASLHRELYAIVDRIKVLEGEAAPFSLPNMN
jgi:hypothetical protein